ncbi:MAG: class I SAM-dependent rRNA methyltransferase [Myxococcales bacterium]|nr:class I SAM-dependent rRNA methyltransferase [Myxococcales bacterium]
MIPTVVLKKGKLRPVYSGHPWIFSGALQNTAQLAVAPGTLVLVRDDQQQPVGWGHIGSGVIAVRMFSLGESEPDERSVIRNRIQEAFARREFLGLTNSPDITGYRLVCAEGDRLPGLMIDRLGDGFVVQAGTAAWARLADVVIDTLIEQFSPTWIVWQVSPDAANIESLKEHGSRVVYGTPEDVDSTTVVECGIRHLIDPLGGQKTGFYADQRENRLRLRQLSRKKRILDVFSYAGGFGLSAAAGGASHVTCVETSPRAHRMAQRMAELNDAAIELHNTDATTYLRENARGGNFDIIVLDPPKLVKSRTHIEEGLKKYRNLNMLAMAALRPGAMLFTHSCSSLVSEDEFQRVLTDAATAAGKQLHVLETRGQAPDHPFLAACPEGRYLKCVVAVVSDR